jgi:hypothetical protein
MLDQKQAFQHMVAWAMQNLYNTYKEATEITADEKLTDEEKTIKLKGPNGTDYRLVNYLALLSPVIHQAELEFPEHKEQFFAWAKDRWDYVKSMNLINGECQCKGCKKEEPVVS